MAKSFKLREVFTPGGMPSVTYVDRANLGLERKLREALDRGYSIITVSGPTKSGKTVLCRTVVPAENSIWLEGGRVKSEGDFWSLLADRLNVSRETSASQSSGNESGNTLETGATVGIPGFVGAKGSGSTQNKRTRSVSMSKIFDSDVPNRCIDAARQQKKIIVIDDFHFIEKAIQKSIVNSLKSAIFDGLDVIVIAVPHRAFDPLAVQQEMQGRFIHVEVTNWSKDELIRIPEVGFPALNVRVERRAMNKICEESIGNPLLVQDLCFRLCSISQISKTQDREGRLDDARLEDVCITVAENSGFPIFERLARGPQSRKERRMRPLKNGGEVDTYQAILLAIAESGAKTVTPYDEIRAGLREILEEGGLPQKNEITSACGHMSTIARNELENVEPIEWHNDALVISDPFLLFYIRWRKAEILKKLASR